MEQQSLQIYESAIERTSRFYYNLYRGKGDFDLGDLEQAGRMAVLNISRKRPEKFDNLVYVRGAIKLAVLGEMRKMWRKEKHIYLAREEGEVPLIDVIPTNERGNQFDEEDELIYRIKSEFSEKEAEGLRGLLEKCENIYDINLTGISTDTKDRIKVVTRMNLADEEMQVYAEVLLGVRSRFPDGYVTKNGKRNEVTVGRLKKYFVSLLDVLEMTPREFVVSPNKKGLLKKYRLYGFLSGAYHLRMTELVRDIDPTVELFDLPGSGRKWNGSINLEEILSRLHQFVKESGKTPERISREDFEKLNISKILSVFGGNSKLTIETAFPGTYPVYQKQAEEFKMKYGREKLNMRGKKYLGFKGFESPLAYFLAHSERYQRKSRTELNELDHYLYRALCDSNQIDKAIPKKKVWSQLSERQIEQIRDAFTKYGGLKETVRHLPFSYNTVRKYIRIKILADLEPRSVKPSCRK